ncbi:MAG: hypothetical protein DMG80_16660 [Acidobacteria bacterium]|nr:MAG: hypothetical protein DMG80_16660 [Acidobacteriota bacterium]
MFGERMKLNQRSIRICWLLLALPLHTVFAQKVSVGYDKSADFSKYKTYTWAQPTKPPTRPMLYLAIEGSIDYELKAKGLARTESDGDLVVVPGGGMEFGINYAVGTPIMPTYSGPPAMDATMWTGAMGASNLMAPYVPEGTLVVNLVDRNANKVIWTGTVKQKLDMEKKTKSLKLIDKAIVKLLKEFPPRKQ